MSNEGRGCLLMGLIVVGVATLLAILLTVIVFLYGKFSLLEYSKKEAAARQEELTSVTLRHGYCGDLQSLLMRYEQQAARVEQIRGERQAWSLTVARLLEQPPCSGSILVTGEPDATDLKRMRILASCEGLGLTQLLADLEQKDLFVVLDRMVASGSEDGASVEIDLHVQLGEATIRPG